MNDKSAYLAHLYASFKIDLLFLQGAYMVAKVRTNRVFDGRMYGKTRPNSCTVDVRRSLDFELYLGFNDINCDVRQDIPGKYASDVIIQVG